jgi:hypothetical protein
VGERGLRGRGLATIAVAAALGLLFVSAISAGSVLPTPIGDDPYTDGGDGHQHKTQVEPDSYAHGQTIVALTQSGRWYAGGGASNLVFSSSQNGGKTWTTGGLPGTTVNATPPGPWPRISDPSIAYDPEHNTWLALGLGIDGTGTGHILLVNRSTNGGVTWTNPVTAAESTGAFWDKTWITCDPWPNSPFYGNCYIQFDIAGGNSMRMVTSTDGGLTWGPVTAVPGSPSGLGGQPIVQPNGNVIVPYTANYSAIYAFRSTNGGQSWGETQLVSNQSTHGIAGGMRDPPMPSVEVDNTGKVYVVWADCRFRAGCPSNDIVMSTSTDGQTWTSPVRIPIEPIANGYEHFHAGLAVDRGTGGATAHLGLGYYYYPQASCSASTCELTFGSVSSLDGGSTWSAPKQVSGPAKPIWVAFTNQGYMVGDYTSSSFTGDGKLHTVFSLAKPPAGGVNASCYPNNTGCAQRLAQATFDITAPPAGTTTRVRREKVRYREPALRLPEDEPYYPTSN